MTDLQTDQHTFSDGSSLKENILRIKKYLYYLKTKWIIIVLAGVIGAAIGLLNVYRQEPLYTASFTFAIEDEKGGNSGLGGALGLASSLGFDLGSSAGGAFSGANLMELLKSRRLIEETLLSEVSVNGNNITLAEMYIQLNDWRTAWAKNSPSLNQELVFPVNADRSKFSRKQDSLLGMLHSTWLASKNLNINQKDKKTSIISITVVSRFELFAKYFAEALVKVVSQFYIETKSKKAKQNVAILEKQADSIRAELNSAITGVAVANDNTYNLNPALNVRRTPSLKRQIDVQANTAILTQLVTNLELAKVTLRKETPLIQEIDRPILPLPKNSPSKRKYVLIGGILAGIITVLLLSIKPAWQSIMR